MTSFIALVTTSLVIHVLPGSQGGSFHLLLPLGWGSGYTQLFAFCGLFVPKGLCLSTISLCLEQSQALYLLGSDESGMALQSLPFHTSHFNQKWAEARGQEIEAKKLRLSQVLAWSKPQGPEWLISSECFGLLGGSQIQAQAPWKQLCDSSSPDFGWPLSHRLRSG